MFYMWRELFGDEIHERKKEQGIDQEQKISDEDHQKMFEKLKNSKMGLRLVKDGTEELGHGRSNI